jgi:threonine dehydratase
VARSLGIPAVICLSERVPAHKRDAIVDLGARVVVAGPTQESAEAEARRLVDAEGLVFVHPFDDPAVIAGQGTVGLEILVQVPDARCLVVPLSGGGLIAGIGLAVEPEESGVSVFGASQDRGPAMHDSLRAGRLVDVVEEDTLADALAGGLGDENHYTFELCRQLVEDVALVSEDEMAEAIRLLHRDHDLKVEGGGAVGVAAVLAGRLPLDGPTVVVVSGGNIGEDAWRAIVSEAVPSPEGGGGSGRRPLTEGEARVLPYSLLLTTNSSTRAISGSTPIPGASSGVTVPSSSDGYSATSAAR